MTDRAVHSSCGKNGAENLAVPYGKFPAPHIHVYPCPCQLVGMIRIPVRAGRKIALCGMSFVWLLLIVS